METKDVEVACPCCGTRLLVDVRTGRVLRTNRPVEHDETGKRVVKEEDWSSASGRVRDRLTSAEEKFDAGLTRERSREDELDDLFKQARDKALGEDEDA